MNSWPLALFALAVATLPAAARDLPARVTVHGDRLTLADLVDRAPAGWENVALGPAPRPGRERTLSRAWILQRARQVGADEILAVAGDVVVSRPGTEVKRDRLVDAVTEALAGRLGPEEQVRVTSVHLPPAVPPGDLELQVELPRGPLPSPATVWVDVLSDGARRARAWARVEVYRSEPMLVLARDVRRGEVLGPEDLEVVAGDAPWGTLTDPAEAVGQRVARSLSAGSPVSPRDLEAVPVVARGDTVRVVARVGSVVASTLGTALETGGVGDRLRVKNLASGRTVTGILREAGVVDANPEPER